ncbi:hypothetical protein cypCar_00016958 [Cyprinus carpio]|nr:hypothetical protein cypCar_00016958 [Cyprinus carpio]
MMWTPEHKHPSFKDTKTGNNIMLLKLSQKINPNNHVNLIRLPEKGEDGTANRVCSVMGWGRKRPNGPLSARLLEANVFIENQQKCHYGWGDEYIDSQMICVHGSGGSCEYDSGGPLVCGATAVGITSFGVLPHCTFGADIVNGQKAKKNSMLYMASVQTDGKHSCGGFLIHPSYVLTAAHCNKNVKTVNDIMLLELSKKLKNGKGMKTIETLSKDKALEPKTKCKVAGWGQTEQENTVNNLLETDVLTINSSICHTLWKEVRVKLPNNVLCAGVSRPKVVLARVIQVDRWCAVRIVSFSLSQNCDYPNFPNVYTEISKYK